MLWLAMPRETKPDDVRGGIGREIKIIKRLMRK
jgi:hypothetical protein